MRFKFSSLAVLALVALAPASALGGDREDKAAAEQIAKVLRDSGQMRNYSVGVKYKKGTVWLSGKVTSQQQMQAALDVVSDLEGIQQIVNNLSVSQPSTASLKQPAANRPSARRTSATSADMQMATKAGGSAATGPADAEVDGEATPAGYHRLAARRHARIAPPAAVCAPVGAAGPIPAALDQPHMPNYAWPSYAASPNYAALTYPKQYSPTAWPFIGPFYPYPQVPLGWRKVSLEWDDGWWFLDFYDRHH